jgi:3',5'-cyclic AMP phosphodiesterase CpdA
VIINGDLALSNGQSADTLKVTMEAQGLLGQEQRGWLAKMLDEHADKPALAFAHHNPRLGGEEKHFPGRLEDSEALWEVFAARPQVKAYIHGHIHHRDYFVHRGIHILNTPAVSFVSNPKESTTGWTMARLSPEVGSFITHTHLPEHAEWCKGGAAVSIAICKAGYTGWLNYGTTSPEPVYTHFSTRPFLMRACASVSNLPNIVWVSYFTFTVQ